MTTHDDIRALCAKLPGVTVGDARFAMGVWVKGKHKGFAWTWMERVHPKKPKQENDRVLAVRVPNLTAKEAILSSDTVRFFTEPHYEGFPAVLVRLDAIEPHELDDLLIEAWRCLADPAQVAEFEGNVPG
jgi:hypothetical protein